MIDDTYLTIAAKAEGLYKEKGSKFIAQAFPVKNEEEIKQYLDDVKKHYHDARHRCYAYVLGKNGEVYRSNDDGEPNHSAGDPILGQIRSNSLTDVLVVVVRYFGGTKLGVGGLISAYKMATADALFQSSIIRATVKKKIEIRFEYLSMNDIMRLIKENAAEIKEQEFGNTCRILVEVRLGLLEIFVEKLSALIGVMVQKHL